MRHSTGPRPAPRCRIARGHAHAHILLMQARPFQLPLTSLLRKRIGPGDFVDSYAVPLADPELTPVQLAERLTVMPGWVNGLLWLRNGLVSPLGLKTGADLPPA